MRATASPDLDYRIVEAMLTAIARPRGPLAYVRLLGEPVPTARARRGKQGHWYTPNRTAMAEKAVAEACLVAMRGRQFKGPVALAAVFFRPDRRRMDLDNLLKTLMDGATKGRVWLDDSQVVAQSAVVELDAENPRTVFALCSVASAWREAR